MYDPKGNSKEKTAELVTFTEQAPPEHLRTVVHRFLSLKTDQPLPNDYRFHALPDACTYIVLDQRNPKIAGITKLRASSEELNLGKTFHYINIRFLPGVWQRDQIEPDHGMINSAYSGDLPLIATNTSLKGKSLEQAQPHLITLVEHLIATNLLVPNPVTEKIFSNLDDIHTVADMAELSEKSPRQLQRILKHTTGLAPHDFLKVLRLQQALSGEPSLSYADQSHFIHSFRKATGYTPGKYAQKFDV